MARARLLKPDFFEDEKLATVPLGARLLFSALWCLADKEGRLQDRPARIAAFAFPPMGNERTQAAARKDTTAWLTALAGKGCIVRYEVDGEPLMYIPSWARHQKIHPNEPKSALPPPMVTNDHQGNPKDTNVAGSGSRKEAEAEADSEAEAEAEAETGGRGAPSPMPPALLEDRLPDVWVELKPDFENTFGLVGDPMLAEAKSYARQVPALWFHQALQLTREKSSPISWRFTAKVLNDALSEQQPPIRPKRTANTGPPGSARAQMLERMTGAH